MWISQSRLDEHGKGVQSVSAEFHDEATVDYDAMRSNPSSRISARPIPASKS
jgi:hypothetical protein